MSRFSKPAFLSLLLTALVLGVYWQARKHAFNFDDYVYVCENPYVRTGLSFSNVRWAFSAFHAGNWHPLTWLSHMTDVEMFGLRAGYHHLVNVACHLLNTLLLFWLFHRMTGSLWRSGFVAAIFAAHPLQVETAAWVAERKNLLSALFWLLALHSYLTYVKRPGVTKHLLMVECVALGLLSKAMTVTLPFVLLLLDWWPLGRFATRPGPGASLPPAFEWAALPRLLREKGYLFLLSAATCAVAFLSQSAAGTIGSLAQFPFTTRIGQAIVSYAVYLSKTVWPSSLAAFYPYPVNGNPAWKVAVAGLLVIGISLAVLSQRRCRPHLVVGWLWYLGTLIPVIGLVQVGNQAMADRYMYIPIVGLSMAVVWEWGEVSRASSMRRIVLMGAGGAAVLGLALTAWLQVGRWRTDLTLFDHALKVTDNNWIAWHNLGCAYAQLGQFSTAGHAFTESVRLKPDFARAWSNLGCAFINLGQNSEAIAAIREAIRLKPAYVDAWYNLGVACRRSGELRRAALAFRQAIRLEPAHATAWFQLGAIYRSEGNVARVLEVEERLRRMNSPLADRFSSSVALPLIFER